MDDEIVATERKKKSDMDLIKIIQCYDSKQQKFKFGDHEPRGISSEDVAEIFGLNNKGVELPNTDKSHKNMKDNFVKTYFAKQRIVKKKDILEAYEKSIKDETPEGSKATASIICVHLLQSLLFATSGTYIAWSFITICGALDQISKYNWAKGVRDYLFKMINKSKKKKKNGQESATTSGCTALILYWICLHTNLVETITGRENMVPAIGRWDVTKIYKAIRDIAVQRIQIGGSIPRAEPTEDHSNLNQEEHNAIPSCEQNNESSKKKEKKITGSKRKRTEAEAQNDHIITITEAQLQFDQLYKEELMKLDAVYQKDMFGIDNTLSVEGFEEFRRCVSMDQKRNLVLSHMMIHALDNLHTDAVVTTQTTGALNRNIEKLLQERHEDEQKISAMNFEMKQLQLKNTAASIKVNKLLDEIGSLKKKLLEKQATVPDLNDDQFEEHTHEKGTATEDPEQTHATDHGPDDQAEEDQAEEDQEHEGKHAATAKETSAVQQSVQMHTPTGKDTDEQGKEPAKKKTRTLVKNIRKRDDRKPNVDPHYDYIPIQKKQKKAKYIFAVSDSESPSIVPSQSQLLEPLIEIGKDQPKVQSPLNPNDKEISKKAAKNPPKMPKQKKEKLDKRYRLPAATRAYKLLEDETREKFKEYYRQDKILYCGIFVIQFANQVQKGKPIEATFEKDEVFAKRAEIATTLVNHENSYANGLQKILEDRRRQNKYGQYDDILDEDFITVD